MNLPYEKLTPILGDDATYDPKTETTPDFMNGKFEELLQNDKACKEQINVLNESINISKELELSGGWIDSIAGQKPQYSISGKTLNYFIRAKGGLITQGTVIAKLPTLKFGTSFQIFSPSSGAILGSGSTNASGEIIIYSCSTNSDIAIYGMGVLA